jgi:hypothetical protein
VRQFAVIPIDPSRLDQLSGMESLVTAAISEPVVLRDVGPAQEAADAAGATALAGFRVRAPASLPADAVLTSLVVQAGPAVRVDVNRDRAQALLEAAGVEDIRLPEVAILSATADIGVVVAQEYQLGNGEIVIVQSPSPAVTMPAGLDVPKMGEALLRLLGTPEADAQRLAQQIDWTSTLIIPLPTNLAQFREISVDGVTGLLLEEVSPSNQSQPELVLLWQRVGIVYAAAGHNVSVEVLLQVADSLR